MCLIALLLLQTVIRLDFMTKYRFFFNDCVCIINKNGRFYDIMTLRKDMVLGIKEIKRHTIDDRYNLYGFRQWYKCMYFVNYLQDYSCYSSVAGRAVGV